MTGTTPSLAAVVDLARLPAIPHVLLKLIECCQQEDASFEALSGIIRQDPALTARVVAAAQSSALAQWNHLNDLNRILVVLGVDVIKTIAITSAVSQYFSQLSPGAGDHRSTLWRDAITCAHASQALARLTSYPRPEEAYLTGLLHNIGRLVYLHQHPDDYAALMAQHLAEEALDSEERSRFGAPSPELGALLVRDWAPDSFISDAIRFQREPAAELGDTPALVRLVNLTHKLHAPGLDPDRLYTEADRLFGLDAANVEQLREDAQARVAATARQFNIALDERGQAQLEDEATRRQLARQVESFAMLHGLAQQRNTPWACAQTLWGMMLRNLAILFGLGDALAFAYQPEHRWLRGVNAGRLAGATLDELCIELENSRSLLVQALQAQRVLSLEAGTAPPVIDQQLQRRLGEGQLTAIPLFGAQAPLGVIAVALPAGARAPSALLLEQFRRGAGEALQTWHEADEATRRHLDQQREQWHDHQQRLVHEAGNPLGVIQNYLHLLSQKLQEGDEMKEPLQVIRGEIDRVGSILLRMKAPPQASPLGSGTADANALITDLITLYRDSVFATHGIHCRLQLDPELTPFPGNANSLKQVITNLLKNAAEALSEGGTIGVETHHINVGGSPFVEIRIHDDGPGVPADLLPRLFAPLTSTKGESHCGLGLTIVANLVHQLEGTISCHNRDAGGAEFVIRLPRLSTHQPAAAG